MTLGIGWESGRADPADPAVSLRAVLSRFRPGTSDRAFFGVPTGAVLRGLTVEFFSARLDRRGTSDVDGHRLAST